MYTQCALYNSAVQFLFVFLYNVHINECTFDIFDKPILSILGITKKELTNVEIQQQLLLILIYTEICSVSQNNSEYSV